jgi:hypothetical protein
MATTESHQVEGYSVAAEQRNDALNLAEIVCGR